MTRKIICGMIEIKGSLTRHKILKKNIEAQLLLLEEGEGYSTD